jgi:hypothetical protein
MGGAHLVPVHSLSMQREHEHWGGVGLWSGYTVTFKWNNQFPRTNTFKQNKFK